MSKLIVIAGIKRSGSTWMYNAVRLCLLHAGHSVHIAGDGQYFQPVCEADYQIVKKHPFDRGLAEAADYVFTSDRYDEGIRASWERFSGEKLSDLKLAKWRLWLNQWRKYTCYEMEWNRFCMKKLDTITLISYELGVSVESWDVMKLLNVVRPPIDRDYDPETMLFHNHITR